MRIFLSDPEPMSENDKIIATICKKVKENVSNIDTKFKDLKWINDNKENLLIHYFSSFGVLHSKDKPLTIEELKFVIENSDLEYLSKHGNSALNIAIKNNEYINPQISSEIYDLLLKSTNLSQLNSKGNTSFDFILDYYFSPHPQRCKLPLTTEQLNKLYAAHLKVKPLTQEQTELFATILADVNKNSDLFTKNKALIDGYLKRDFSHLEPQDKEIEALKAIINELKQQVKTLALDNIEIKDKFNQLQKQLTDSNGILNIEDKPSLSTTTKLNTARSRLTKSKAEDTNPQPTLDRLAMIHKAEQEKWKMQSDLYEPINKTMAKKNIKR